MAYLLDTNACIRILNGTSVSVVNRLMQESPTEIAMSSVVRAELTFGAYKSNRVAENLRLLKVFFEPFRSFAFDDACSEAYSVIRSDLEREGRPIGPNDLLIAATAVAHDLTLVTAKVEEFGRVAGLMLENWE